MNKVCRICLEEGVLTSVFTKNFNISLSEMIEYCSNIKINKDEGLPEQICSSCIYKLGIAYHFKQTCESADLRLRQYLGIPKFVRYADAAVLTDPMIPLRQTIIKKCKCRPPKRTSNTYKRKSEEEKLKRGPKPKLKQKHSCYQCGKEFRCQAHLETHVRTHTGDKPFQCVYCPRSFSQKHNLTIHLRIHTGEKPFQCEVCSKTFAAQGNLQAHVKIHTSQKDHVCTMCNKRFITSSELLRHVNNPNKCTKKIKCDLCDKTYTHMRHLKTHKLKMHNISVRSDSPELQVDNTHKDQKFNIIDVIGVDIKKQLQPSSEVKTESEKNIPKNSNLLKNEQDVAPLYNHEPYRYFDSHRPYQSIHDSKVESKIKTIESFISPRT